MGEALQIFMLAHVVYRRTGSHFAGTCARSFCSRRRSRRRRSAFAGRPRPPTQCRPDRLRPNESATIGWFDRALPVADSVTRSRGQVVHSTSHSVGPATRYQMEGPHSLGTAVPPATSSRSRRRPGAINKTCGRGFTASSRESTSAPFRRRSASMPGHMRAAGSYRRRATAVDRRRR